MKLYMILIAFLLAISCTSNGADTPQNDQPGEDRWKELRLELVSGLKSKGITDERVIQAMSTVPRHEFVPRQVRADSYQDHPLPIGLRQTISQPFIVAYMCEALKLSEGDKVLEIGTGSGYHAAVMSMLAEMVYTIEIIPELGKSAAKLLEKLGYANVKVMIGDGYRGWPEYAPFDAIILTAAPPEIPQPLLDQMKVGGRLIAPIGRGWQKLVLVERTEEGYRETELLPVTFVPMTGEAQKGK